MLETEVLKQCLAYLVLIKYTIRGVPKKETCAYRTSFSSNMAIGEYRVRALKNRKGDLKLNTK